MLVVKYLVLVPVVDLLFEITEHNRSCLSELPLFCG